MLLVTGATGTIGNEVVTQLLAADQPVRILTRNPERAARYAGDVEVAKGDLASPESLAAAFAGVDKVFLLATGLALPQLEGNAIEAAKRAGVKHVVKLSVRGAELDRGLALGRWHREGEKALEASGIAWTILRPGSFASNALGWVDTIKAQGLPSHRQRQDRSHRSARYRRSRCRRAHRARARAQGLCIDGPRGPGHRRGGGVVAKISTATGRPIDCIEVPETLAGDGMLAQGMSLPLAEAVLELMALIREGYGSGTMTTVGEVLGRKGRTFDAWLQEHVMAFR